MRSFFPIMLHLTIFASKVEQPHFTRIKLLKTAFLTRYYKLFNYVDLPNLSFNPKSIPPSPQILSPIIHSFSNAFKCHSTIPFLSKSLYAQLLHVEVFIPHISCGSRICQVCASVCPSTRKDLRCTQLLLYRAIQSQCLHRSTLVRPSCFFALNQP